jgi:arsenate reductase-like glutaredoxin family protein
VREVLAREGTEHTFVDVRKGPISPKDTVAIVRKHRRAISKVGGKMRELDPKTATDAEIEKLFLGREGTMRAPVVSNGESIVAGYDAEVFRTLLR